MERITYKDANGEYHLDDYYVDTHGIDENGLSEITDCVGELEDFEERTGCPLRIITKLLDQNKLYFQFYDELQYWPSIKVDLRNNVVWFCKQVGGHYACNQPLSNYGKTFWLREDKSE